MYRKIGEIFDIIDPITDQKIFIQRIDSLTDISCEDCYFHEDKMGCCGFYSLEAKREVLGDCAQYNADINVLNSIFRKVDDTTVLELIIK